MSYLDRLDQCNRFDPEAFLPFRLDGRRVGFVRRDAAPALADHPDVFTLDDRAVSIAPGLDGRDRITAALASVAGRLVERGLVQPPRSELFAITERWGGAVMFELDRATVPFFGTRSYGVHLNGLRPDAPEPSVWIGRRAPDKKVAPGKLDNLVAGGIGSGYHPWTTLVKEAAEEAGMPEELVAAARPVGAVIYRMAVPEGLRDDVLFLYDIVLPADFVPVNTDGEMAEFHLMTIARCLELVAGTEEFKFNVGLTLIDLALRKGLIGPEDPDYLSLVAGLRGGLVRGPS